MAKQEPFVTDGDGVAEPGDLWFEFGATEKDALLKLLAGIAHRDPPKFPHHHI